MDEESDSYQDVAVYKDYYISKLNLSLFLTKQNPALAVFFAMILG